MVQVAAFLVLECARAPERYNRQGAESNTMIRKDGKQARGTQSTNNNTKSDGIEQVTANRKVPSGDRTLNQGKECPPQATPAALEPWQATAQKSGKGAGAVN
jgi:hypothetical protein